MKVNNKINGFRRNMMRKLTKNIGNDKGKLNSTNLDSIKRILINRPNSRLGNQLLATPLLQELQRVFPNAHVDLFVRSRIAPIIFQNYTNVDKIITLPSKPYNEIFKYLGVWFSLLKQKYDLVINIDSGSSSGRLSTALSKAEYKLFCDSTEQFPTVFSDYFHMAKRPVYCLRNYIGQTELSTPLLPSLSILLKDDERLKGHEIIKCLTKNDKKTIGIYTFATGNKCLSTEWWTETYEKICRKFQDEYNIIEVLPIENVSQIDFKAPSYYSRDIREMAGVMDNLTAFVTADCGIMHLASATNTPIVSLFSITSPTIYRPYNNGSVVLETKNINNTDEVIDELTKIVEKNTINKM